MTATYLGFAAAVAVLIASPGPVVALVVADARHRWPLWTILGGVLSALILLVAALLLIQLALGLQPFILAAVEPQGHPVLSRLSAHLHPAHAAIRHSGDNADRHLGQYRSEHSAGL